MSKAKEDKEGPYHLGGGRVCGGLQLIGGHGVETLDHGHAGGHQLLQLLSLETKMCLVFTDSKRRKHNMAKTFAEFP